MFNLERKKKTLELKVLLFKNFQPKQKSRNWRFFDSKILLKIKIKIVKQIQLNVLIKGIRFINQLDGYRPAAERYILNGKGQKGRLSSRVEYETCWELRPRASTATTT
jgi:hypothetical protein